MPHDEYHQPSGHDSEMEQYSHDWEKIIYRISTSKLTHGRQILDVSNTFFQNYLNNNPDISVVTGSSNNLHFNERGGGTDQVFDVTDPLKATRQVGSRIITDAEGTVRVRNIHFPENQKYSLFGETDENTIYYRGDPPRKDFQQRHISGELHAAPFIDPDDKVIRYDILLSEPPHDSRVNIEVDMGHGKLLFVEYDCDQEGAPIIGKNARYGQKVAYYAGKGAESFTFNEVEEVLQHFGFLE